jgi:hypothetical protein
VQGNDSNFSGFYNFTKKAFLFMKTCFYFTGQKEGKNFWQFCPFQKRYLEEHKKRRLSQAAIFFRVQT